MLSSFSRLPAIGVIMAAGLAVAACTGTPGSTSISGSGSASDSNSAPNGSNQATSGTSPGAPATIKYASAQATVIGKSTDVVVNPAVSAALKRAGIIVTAVAPATAKTTLFFPISGGQLVVATLAGIVDHRGGLTFSHHSKSITLTNLVINTNTKELTATVGGQSLPIFHLNLASTRHTRGPQGSIVIGNIMLTVTSRAAIALNGGFNVSTFKAGMKFGTAALTVSYARGHR